MRLNNFFQASIVGTAAFTVTMLAYPPETALSQDHDTVTRPAPKPATIPLPIDSSGKVLNRISDKTEQLNQAVKDIKEGNKGIIQETNKTDKLVDKMERIISNPPAVASDPPDTVTVIETIPVIVRDSSLDGKTWWGRFFATNKRLLKQCNLHKWLKHKHPIVSFRRKQ